MSFLRDPLPSRWFNVHEKFQQETCHFWKKTKSCSPENSEVCPDWATKNIGKYALRSNVTIYWRTNFSRMAQVKLRFWCSVVSIFHALLQFSKACLTLLDSHQYVRVCQMGLCDRGICGGGTYEDKYYSTMCLKPLLSDWVRVPPLLSSRPNEHACICLWAQRTANWWSGE